MSVKRWLPILGILISALALFVALNGLDWTRVGGALQRASIGSLAVALGFLAVGVYARAERWRLFSTVSGHRPTFYRATALGMLGNYIYPGRAGDAIRIGLVARKDVCPLWRASVSGIVDRGIDVAVMFILAGLLLWLQPTTPLRREIIYIGLVAIAVGGFTVLYAPARQHLANLTSTIINSVLSRIIRITNGRQRIREGLTIFRASIVSPKRATALLLGIGAVITLDYLAIASLLAAFGWTDSMLLPILVWVFISAGSAIPAAPAALGVHQVACTLALGMHAIPPEEAIAFSFLTQVVTLAAILVTAVLSSPPFVATNRQPS